VEKNEKIQLYKELETIISNIEQEIRGKITNKIAFLIHFIRAIDTAYLLSIGTKENYSRNLFAKYIYGWPAILSITYHEVLDKNGYPLFPSNEGMIENGHILLDVFSRAESIKKLLSMARYDLLNIEKIDDKQYKFTLANSYSQVEHQEMLDYMNFEKSQTSISAFTEKIEDIHSMMEGLVFTFEKHFIGYSSNKRIDDFYLVLGTCFSDRFRAKHDFPENAKFGGVKYVDYVAAISVFIGLTLKHLDFCNILIKKDPNIEYINIVSIFKTIDEEIETLCTALEISRDTAEKVMDVLIFSKEDTDKRNSNFNSTYPLFLKVSKDFLIRSALGFLVDPFAHLLQQLSNRFPKDWSREINSREKLFREQLYNIIPDDRDFIKINKNINIYKNKLLLTDIDALIIDLKSNTMLLFQLKWQEPFGGSMSERNSKKNNFIDTSNKWIEAVDEWIMSSDAKQKADVLGLKKETLEKITNYKMVVLGRHFSKFSGCSAYDNRAVWCNWYKFNEVCETNEKFQANDYFNKLESTLR